MRESLTISDKVRKAVENAPVTDIHTHLYAPAFGPLLLWGIDELLNYHYLTAEALRWWKEPVEAFWRLDRQARAETVWKLLFVDRAPVSEACRGVVTVVSRLGFNPQQSLRGIRDYFEKVDFREHVDRVFSLAGVRYAVMTNDPFDEEERPVWFEGRPSDRRFLAALRLDVLLERWETAAPKLASRGYKVAADFSGDTAGEVRRFLGDWIERLDALYMAVSLPGSFAYPEASVRGRLLDECVLPAAAARKIPLALMIGVARGVNPELGQAGDGLARGSVEAVEALCRAHPAQKFLVTFLSRENQHQLCAAARKFRNLMVFGCWWFLNTPGLVRETTRTRLELLGSSFIPQHSDARVLEQLIYKWDHARRDIGTVLGEAFEDLEKSGWYARDEEIKRAAWDLLGGNFWTFLGTAPPVAVDLKS